MISIDSECGGVDHFHGSTHPFYVTTCDDNGNIRAWEWQVDPTTRKVLIDQNDVEQIRDMVLYADAIVGQNLKYDVVALEQAGIITDWPWQKTEDTLIAAHLLASNHPKNLTALAIEYIGVDIKPYEDVLHRSCIEARRVAKSKFPDWRIAKEGLPEMPSAKGGKDKGDRGVASDSPWAMDMWLPRAVATARKDRKPLDSCEHVWDETTHLCHKCLGHRWWIVLSEYSNWDSSVTLPIWRQMEIDLHKRGLWKIYQERRKLPRIAVELEKRGVTVNREVHGRLRERFVREADDASKRCVDIAASYEVETCVSCGRLAGESTGGWDKRCKCEKSVTVTGPFELELPKGAVNDSMRSLCFSVMKLDHVTNPKAKTDAPTLDSKNAIPHYINSLPKESKQYNFITSFAERNSFTTAISYLNNYERYWLPMGIFNERGEQMWCRLHSSLNPVGTDHLRWSSSNPNQQNWSKKESECLHCEGEGCDRCDGTGKGKVSLRECLGPSPGREYWSLDAMNIERRMPAYECNEEVIIELLEEPDKPPYYGSEHALVGHILYPKQFNTCKDANGNLDGRIFKKLFKDYYQRTKNTNFALQYQAGKATVDRTAGFDGAYELVKSRFWKQEALNKKWVDYANKYGYVETMPDRDVDPDRGYPILCSRSQWGKVLPTVPLNYHSSGSAMWWTCRAQVKVQECLDEWNRKLSKPDYFMAIQCHDELVIDMSKRADPRKNPKGSNLWRMREIKRLMESCGPPMGIPTPVSLEYNPVSWQTGYTIAV